MYKIDKIGNIYEYNIDSEIINSYLNKVKNSFTEDYYIWERKCKAEADYTPLYTTLFMGSTIKLPLDILNFEMLGKINKYQYYEDILFDKKFRVYNNPKIRLNNKFEFNYLIDDTQERLPSILIKEIVKSRLIA